jgi:hypothetical protein
MLGLLFLAERTIRESVAQGFEIVALGAFPASMASIGSQLVVRRRLRRGAVRARRARLWCGSNAARKGEENTPRERKV